MINSQENAVDANPTIFPMICPNGLTVWRFELCVACHVLEILQGEGDFRIRGRFVAANQPMGKHWTYFPMAVWQENIVAPASTLIISNASEVLSHPKKHLHRKYTKKSSRF